MDGSSSVSPHSLVTLIGSQASPIIIDVRRQGAFDADDRMMVSALRRVPEQVEEWAADTPTDRQVVVYCVHGHEASHQVAAALRAGGPNARHLEGGLTAWTELGLPLRKKLSTQSATWVTRERPKIDRIACPWLIRRFIDPEAAFLYVPTERVFEAAATSGAIAYDIPGEKPFRDAALDTLAVIVRGADAARLELAPQAAGLLALSLGLSANFPDDHAMLENGIVMYDALYAWCRSLQGETHDWTRGTP